MSKNSTQNSLHTGPPGSALAREQLAQKGVRFSGEIVGAHVEGIRRADEFISGLSKSTFHGDALAALAGEIATVSTLEGHARARGFFSVIQKRLVQVVE